MSVKVATKQVQRQVWRSYLTSVKYLTRSSDNLTFHFQRQMFMTWPTASNLKIDDGDGNLTLYMRLDADVLLYETGPRSSDGM